jgi:hypothetical protein
VHTFKYDVALLGLVGVALDIFDCGQATHNSSVCEQQSKKMRMLLLRLLLLTRNFWAGSFLASSHCINFGLFQLLFIPKSLLYEPFMSDVVLFKEWKLFISQQVIHISFIAHYITPYWILTMRNDPIY